MKRIVLAAIALALLVPIAFARTDDHAGAQTATGPSFADASITYTLDESSNGSSTAIAIGTPAFTAGAVSGGTDACAEGSEFLNADLATFVSTGGTASSVFSVSSACAITYTGAASASAISAARAGWSLTVNISDGVDAAGNADATVDDSIQVTIKLVNAATDAAAAKALYDGAGGSSWTTSTNWSFPTIVAGYPLLHTFEMTAGQLMVMGETFIGYSGVAPLYGSIRNNSGGPITLGGTTYTTTHLEQWSSGTGTPVLLVLSATTGTRDFNHLSGLRLRIGTRVSVGTGASNAGYSPSSITVEFPMPWGTITNSANFTAQLLGTTAQAAPALSST